MADNVAITAGTGTSIATDDIGGVQYQRVKVTHGADGTATDASTTNPLPVTQRDPELGLAAGTTTLRDQLFAQRYTVLADSIADGLSPFWVTAFASGGTFALSTGEGLMQTSASATGSAQAVSPAPVYLPGQVAWFNSAIRLGDTGSAGNIRRWGAFTVTGTTPQEGFAYELNGTTLNIVTFKGGVATTTAVGSWSAFATNPFTLTTNYHQFEIRWTANRADFYIDNTLRHTATGGSTTLTGTLNFPMALQNINSSGATNRLIAVRNVGIGRFGHPDGVREAADIARVDRNFILDTWTAAPVADTLMSVVQWYGNVAMGATTQPAVVPAGKRLRLTGGRIETKSLATVGSVLMRIRSNAAGLVVIGSPIISSIGCGTRSAAGTTAATGGHDHAEFTFGDRGHELPAGTGVGFSLAGYGPTGTLTLQGVTRFEVWGYEYTSA